MRGTVSVALCGVNTIPVVLSLPETLEVQCVWW